MKKNPMQDVVMPSKKKRELFVTPPSRIPKKIEHLSEPKLAPIRSLGKKHDWWKHKTLIFGLGGAILAITALFVLSAFYARATITVTPKTANPEVKIKLTSSKNGNAVIPFEITMVKGTESKVIPATGSKKVASKASGRIVIYNNYSGASQKLLGNTRFLGTNNKIYRISSDVTVPGTSVKNGATTPGSLEVTVYADQTGPAYNAGLMDFTIPGFKGDPRYDKFYARSKTDITGGFDGNMSSAGDKEINSARTALKTTLKGDLLAEAASQVPNGYILYKDAVQFDFTDIKDTGNDPSKVSVSESGVLTGVLLRKEDLINVLNKSISSDLKEKMPFKVSSPETLSFSFDPNTEILDASTREVIFTLSGKVKIIYDTNADSLKNELVGKAKADFAGILSKYPGIYKAGISEFRPFWAKYFPGKADKITMSVSQTE